MLEFDVFVWCCCLVLLFSGFVVFGSGFGVLRVREIIGHGGLKRIGRRGKQRRKKRIEEKTELECLKLEFHVDFKLHLNCAST